MMKNLFYSMGKTHTVRCPIKMKGENNGYYHSCYNKTSLPARLLLSCTCFITLLLSGSAYAAEDKANDSISQALRGDWGQVTFNLRYRYERVVEDGLKTGNGDPVRLRIGYLTPKFTGLQAYAAVLGNTPVFLDDFNDSSNGKTEYAVIRDPNEVALDELWITYETIPDTIIKGGRQHIAWDNERFICNAKWRQMGQSFDSITLFNQSLGNFSAKAAYLWTALTTENKKVHMQSPLLNLNYSIPKIGSIIGYGLWLDYDDSDDSGPFEYAYSAQTYGLRLNGSPSISENLQLLYTMEYATQSEYQDNPKDFTTDYYSIIGGLLVPLEQSIFKNFSASIGYEVFGSDNNVSFQTPLGANHRYNGWADIFGKSKPSTGLRDLYGLLSANIAGVKVDLQYHDFHADAGGNNYGTEYDIKITRKFMKHYEILASYSSYDANEYKTDTDKFWLQLTVDF
jgi:Alginate export